jgi:triosephosphate isomerase
MPKLFIQLKYYNVMNFPVVIVNFKAYENSYGKKAIELSREFERISLNSGVEVIIAVPDTMIYRIANEVSLPVYAQSVDSVGHGAKTGQTIIEMIKEAGARGFLINHSEKKERFENLINLINSSKIEGLESIICVDSYEAIPLASLLNPTAVLIEPPELIGTGIAVSKAKPEVIERAVKEANKVNYDKVIAGAGITSGEDVYNALRLGAKGVGVASAVMKAKKPGEALMELIMGVKKYIEGR